MNRMRKRLPVLLLAAVLLTGCAGKRPVSETGTDVVPETAASYTQISQEEAKEMMSADDGHVVVDVRRQDEYDAGHIPGAILIPNESIGTEQPEELPDLSQIILIYCRSGNRSKQAAEKLAAMGYGNIYEFGGINTWTGEIVTEDMEADTAPDSGDEPDQEETVLEETAGEEQVMRMIIGETQVPVTWEENASVKALKSLLPLELSMSMYGGFEQAGSIGQSIVRDDRQMTTHYGDIVLYSGDQLVVFYGSNSWAYTRLGHVELTQAEMADLLGNGDVTITITEDG